MNKVWTVVIADDDARARHRLREVIGAHSEFRTIGEAADGSSAVSLLDRLRPDLAIVAVELPEIDGFDVLRALRPRDWPQALFLAAEGSPSHAALVSAGLDVLSWSEDPDPVDRALDRASRSLAEGGATQRRQLERFLAATESTARLSRLPIRRNGRIEVLELAEVDWISAAGNYVELHSNGRRFLHRITLKTLADRVDPRCFARIHRSTIVNVERVRDLEPTPQGDWKLGLETGDRLRLSRRYREALDLLRPVRSSMTNGYRHA